MKTPKPKLKSKSAETGRYISAKAAKAKPATTFASDDYPARALRKLVRLVEPEFVFDEALRRIHIHKLIASIKKRMGWEKARKVK